MPITVRTNLEAINAARHLEVEGNKYQQAMERLASGKRVNRPGDDAAGLSLSFLLEARVRSIIQAERNAEDALSLIQVAGSGMNEIGNILVRLRELSIQASSDTVSDRERDMLMIEAQQLGEEIDRIANSTSYLGNTLINGQGRSYEFHVGPDASEDNRLSYDSSAVDLRASTLGVDDVDISDKDSAQDVFEQVDEAIQNLGRPLSTIGAMQSRIQAAISHLSTQEESLTAATSRITDADMARESTQMIKGQVQRRASIAVLAQANMLPTMALKLLE